MPIHDRQMKRVSGRQTRVPKDDLLGPFEVDQLGGEDFVGNAQERVEGRLDRVAPIDGDVPVQNLLERLYVRDETLSFGKTPFQDLLSVPLVRVKRPHKVHRNVRIEEDHRGGESR